MRLKCRISESSGPNQRKTRNVDGHEVKHVWLDNKSRQIRRDADATVERYELVENGDLIIRNLSYAQRGEFSCITRVGRRIDSVSTYIYPVRLRIVIVYVYTFILCF